MVPGMIMTTAWKKAIADMSLIFRTVWLVVKRRAEHMMSYILATQDLIADHLHILRQPSSRKSYSQGDRECHSSLCNSLVVIISTRYISWYILFVISYAITYSYLFCSTTHIQCHTYSTRTKHSSLPIRASCSHCVVHTAINACRSQRPPITNRHGNLDSYSTVLDSKGQDWRLGPAKFHFRVHYLILPHDIDSADIACSLPLRPLPWRKERKTSPSRGNPSRIHFHPNFPVSISSGYSTSGAWRPMAHTRRPARMQKAYRKPYWLRENLI